MTLPNILIEHDRYWEMPVTDIEALAAEVADEGCQFISDNLDPFIAVADTEDELVASRMIAEMLTTVITRLRAEADMLQAMAEHAVYHVASAGALPPEFEVARE